MTELTGCVLRPQDGDACQNWLAFATTTGPVAQGTDDLIWLLAHCDEGVVWGRREGTRWKLSSAVYPEVSPTLSAGNLQQLRLFGPFREVLVWRSDEGLLGRELADTGPVAKEQPLRPEDQHYLLIGDRLMSIKEGFTLTADGRGSRHAAPLTTSEGDFGSAEKRHWPFRLQVRHYFMADPRTGLVRVAASRLVHLVSGADSLKG
jgi:CRISPR-associated protein (TIGR03984 family)